MDVLPTVLDVAGVSIPAGLDAVSLVGMARGEAPPPATAAAISEFTFKGPELRSIRTSEEKLVVDHDAGTATLFDLAADPHETVDVGARSPDRVTELRTVLDATETRGEPGFYVLARGGTRAEHFRMMLMSPTHGFVEAHPLGLEDDDRVTLVLGALCESAMVVARSPDPRRALAAVRGEIDGLVTGLRAARNPAR